MQQSPIKGRVALPAQPLDPQEEAEREGRRSYVRRLLDLEAERARLQVQFCTYLIGAVCACVSALTPSV